MKHEFKKIKSQDETRYVLESASVGASSTAGGATVSTALGGVRRRGNILAQETDKTKVPAEKPRNFVAKNAKMGGAGAHKDKKKAAKQGQEKHRKPYMEGEAEGAAFGSRYAEQLAQEVFDHNPNITDEDEVLNLGYNIAKGELGSRAYGIFRDEDFPSDFVSAYFWLKKQKQGVAEGLPQTLRKVVPGYAKREIDKKMDAGKFGKTDADKDANFHRYKKIQDKLKEQGVAEGSTTRGGFGGSAGQAHHEIQWLKNKIETLKPLLVKKPSVARQIKDLERQIRERELAIAYQKEGVAEEAENKDMTGKTCEKCKKGKYQERSQHDDMQGKVTCKCGHRVDRWKKYKDQGVAEGWGPDTTRLEQDVRDALENGDDYTAKQYAKMAPTPEAKKYLLNIIKQAMYIDDLGGETDWKGVAEGSKGTGNPGMPTPYDQGRNDAKKGRAYDNPYDQPGEEQEHNQYKKGYEQGKKQGVAEGPGISQDKETAFHAKLDKLVHNTFGKRKGEMEDHEIQMASSELQAIAKNAVHLLDLVRKYSEAEGLEAWQQSKITKAADYLNSVLQSISGEQSSLSEGAYEDGVSDGMRGEPNRRASSIYGPETGAYEKGYRVGLEKGKQQQQDRLAQAKAEQEPYETMSDEELLQLRNEIKQRSEERQKIYMKLRGADYSFDPKRHLPPNDKELKQQGQADNKAWHIINQVLGSRGVNIDESAPEGWEKTVKAMKKHKDIDNPWALAHWMKGKGYKSHKEDAYMQELADKIAEKLDPNADPDVWIQDFQKADPNKYHQFKNKSPEKKAQMAISARYAARQPKSK